MTLFLIRYLFQDRNSSKEELLSELRYDEICEIREALLMKSHYDYDILAVKKFITSYQVDSAQRYIKKFRPNPVSEEILRALGNLDTSYTNEYLDFIEGYYRVKINLN